MSGITPPDVAVCLWQLLSFCACSSRQGEVVDVQYGSMEDLRNIRDTLNLTNHIAMLKLGQAPLLYTVRLLLCSRHNHWFSETSEGFEKEEAQQKHTGVDERREEANKKPSGGVLLKPRMRLLSGRN